MACTCIFNHREKKTLFWIFSTNYIFSKYFEHFKSNAFSRSGFPLNFSSSCEIPSPNAMTITKWSKHLSDYRSSYVDWAYHDRRLYTRTNRFPCETCSGDEGTEGNRKATVPTVLLKEITKFLKFETTEWSDSSAGPSEFRICIAISCLHRGHASTKFWNLKTWRCNFQHSVYQIQYYGLNFSFSLSYSYVRVKANGKLGMICHQCHRDIFVICQYPLRTKHGGQWFRKDSVSEMLMKCYRQLSN